MNLEAKCLRTYLDCQISENNHGQYYLVDFFLMNRSEKDMLLIKYVNHFLNYEQYKF